MVCPVSFHLNGECELHALYIDYTDWSIYCPTTVARLPLATLNVSYWRHWVQRPGRLVFQ